VALEEVLLQLDVRDQLERYNRAHSENWRKTTPAFQVLHRCALAGNWPEFYKTFRPNPRGKQVDCSMRCSPFTASGTIYARERCSHLESQTLRIGRPHYSDGGGSCSCTSAEDPQHVSYEQDQQYGAQANARTAALTPAAMAVEPSATS
jgi:hypothetical protein